MLVADGDQRTTMGAATVLNITLLEDCIHILNTSRKAWQDKRTVDHSEENKLARKLVAQKLYRVADRTINILAHELGELEMVETLAKVAYGAIQIERGEK